MITTFCPTLGRASLEYTVESFKRSRGATDSLVVLGSGIEKPSWLVESNGVLFEPCKRSKFLGHDLVWPRLTQVSTPYWGYIGDDDCFVPGETEKLHEKLDGEHIIVCSVMRNDGKTVPPIHNSERVHGQLCVDFLTAVVPTKLLVPDFREQSDIWLFDSFMIEQSHYRFGFFLEITPKVRTFSLMSKNVWERSGLQVIGPFREWGRETL